MMNQYNNHTPKKLHPCTWMKKGNFHFIESEEPFLVLYSMAQDQCLNDMHGESDEFHGMPNFLEPERWVSLMHQTAGYACHSYYLHATFLKPKKIIQEGLFPDLLSKYNDSCIARVPTLQTAIEYEQVLSQYDLSANYSYQYLEEGFYPIDIEFLSKVTNEKFPKNLQELVNTEDKKDKKLWSFLNYVHFGLAILGPNCD